MDWVDILGGTSLFTPILCGGGGGYSNGDFIAAFIIKPEAEVVNVLDARDGCPSRLPYNWW